MRPTVLDTPPEVEAIVCSLPARLRPERVEGWEGRFHLVLTGDAKPEWTVVIEDGTCTVREGLHGEPSCVLTMPAKTYVGVETGKKNPMVAFLKGRIKITNVGQMRRYDRAFYKLYDLPKAAASDASPPDEAGAASELWDASRLRESLGDDLDEQRVLLGEYLEQAEALVASIRRSEREGDDEARRRHAHTLKGSSAAVGAVQMVALMHAVEVGTLEDLAAVDQALVELRAELGRTLGLFVPQDG